MTLEQVYLVLVARYRLIILTLVLTVAASAAVTLTMTPLYRSTASLIVEFKGVDPVTGTFVPLQMVLSNLMATEVDILESQAVAVRAVKNLRLAEDPEFKRQFFENAEGKGRIEDWIAQVLRQGVDIKPSKESRMIEVSYTNRDPEFAARAANAIVQSYVQTNLEMKVAPAKNSATWFDSQLGELRNQLEAAQARLTKYQSERGITSPDQKLDIEMTKLAEISSQLVQAQAQSYENASRQRQLQEFTAKDMSVDSLPEVLASPVIHELKTRLSVAEAKLSQASNTLGVNHPEYLRTQSEVTSVRAKLKEEIKTAAAVIGNNLRISENRERELRDALAAQKSRMIELNRNRDEFGVLMKEVENAQHSYDAASQRHTQTTMESRMDQGNASILSPAVPATRPSFPKWPVNLGLATLVGLMLGVGFAFVAELLDRRVRGVKDLMDAVGTEVWGVLTNTAGIARDIERRKKALLKRPRTLTPVQEPTLK